MRADNTRAAARVKYQDIRRSGGGSLRNLFGSGIARRLDNPLAGFRFFLAQKGGQAGDSAVPLEELTARGAQLLDHDIRRFISWFHFRHPSTGKGSRGSGKGSRGSARPTL